MANIKGVKPIIEDAGSCWQLGWIGCPVCGDDQCCDTGYTVVPSPGDYTDTSRKGAFRVKPQRGGCEDLVQIMYHCNSGHDFTLVVHNHKGSMAIYFLVDGKPMPLRQERY